MQRIINASYFKPQLKRAELALFYQQLSTLLAAGIPLLNSVHMMQNMQASLAIKHFLTKIQHTLLEGQPLHKSLDMSHTHLHAFAHPLIYIGEQIGRLDHCLSMIAEFYQSELNYRQQIKQALLYPCILCCLALMMTLGLLLFVIPRFAILFEDHYSQLPALTRFIFFISNTLYEHYFLVALPILYGIFLFLPLSIAEQQRIALQQSLLSFPRIAAIQMKISLCRFCTQLGLLYQAGVPLTDAIKLINNLSSTGKHQLAIQNLQMSLMNGEYLHEAMRRSVYFPSPLPDMIQVGELSGNLDRMLKHVALLYEGEIERTLKQISQLLEPLIMMILGVLIGGLVIGMYLPIFKLGNII
jgi:type IV pilus assembly protein PilC